MAGQTQKFPGFATAVDDILDEDNMSSDSATALATQQSIKKYVDDNAGGTAKCLMTSYQTSMVVSNTTRYAAPNHRYTTGASSQDLDNQNIVPLAGTVKNLYVELTNNPGAYDVVFTITKGGADQALTCTINNATTGNDTSNSFAVAAGDLLGIKCVTPNGATGGASLVAIEIDPS